MAFLLLGGCDFTKAPATHEGNAPGQTDKLSVYTSFYPMYDFTAKMGGDYIDIVNLVPAGTEPHDWEPAAADIIGLEEADVFIYNGAGMEHWVADVLAALENKDLVVVEAAQGITLMEGRHGHDDEGKHGGKQIQQRGPYDPHVWLNPLYAKKQMESIKNALVQADPRNKNGYEANYVECAAALDALDEAFRATLSTLPNQDIIVAHEAFGYLCAAYGLNQIGIEGLSADSEPEPARMAEIIAFAAENHVTTIFFEELASPKVAQTIANAIGAETAVLSPLEGLSDAQQAAGDDYFSVMRQNLEALKRALQ